MGRNTWTVISSPRALNFSSLFFTSISAPPVASNGLPSMIGISLSSSISKIMKYVGKMNLSTFTRTCSITPLGCFSDLSTNWSVTVVGRASPNPNPLNIDNEIRLILALRSHKAFSKMEFPIVHDMVKLLESFSFCGSFYCKMALHSSVRFTVSKFDSLLFLDIISFMNFT